MKKTVFLCAFTFLSISQAAVVVNTATSRLDEKYVCDDYQVKAIQDKNELESLKFAGEWKKTDMLRRESYAALQSKAEAHHYADVSALAGAIAIDTPELSADRSIILKDLSNLGFANNRIDSFSACFKALVKNLNVK